MGARRVGFSPKKSLCGLEPLEPTSGRPFTKLTGTYLHQMALPRRPLPVPPIYTQGRYNVYDTPDDPMAHANSYLYSSRISPSTVIPQDIPIHDEPQPSALRGGTLLHKGFYDLLALIPSTPTSASRFFWRSPDPEPVAGPRYEEIPPARVPTANTALNNAKPPSPTSPQPAKNLKARRISKDMVSKPTGFM